jgi:hypothetical protein
MQMLLQRTTQTSQSVEGTLSVDGKFQCFTLEPSVREVSGKPVGFWKVPGRTAIPVGTYAVEISYFARDGYYSPILDNVPGFLGIRIHIGNFPQDTEGCILVGTQMGDNQVLNSKVAFAALMTKIQAAQQNQEPIQITVHSTPLLAAQSVTSTSA